MPPNPISVLSAHGTQCRRANPVMPSSQAGQLSINFALAAFDAWYSYIG
jgi:hypothetical protein